MSASSSSGSSLFWVGFRDTNSCHALSFPQFFRPHTVVVLISSLIGQPCCDSLHRMPSSSWCICSSDGALLWTGQACGDSLPRMPLSAWCACLSCGERPCFPFSFCRLACPCQCLGLALALAGFPLPCYTTVWFTAFCLSLVMLSSLSGRPLGVFLIVLVVVVHPGSLWQLNAFHSVTPSLSVPGFSFCPCWVLVVQPHHR